MKYTKIPENAFKELQLNAGVLLTDFDTTDGMTEQELLAVMIGATSGGVNFAATPTYEDYGADIDNAPTNVKELKKLTGWEVKMSGSFITVSTSSAALRCCGHGLQGYLVGRRLLRQKRRDKRRLCRDPYA